MKAKSAKRFLSRNQVRLSRLHLKMFRSKKLFCEENLAINTLLKD